MGTSHVLFIVSIYLAALPPASLKTIFIEYLPDDSPNPSTDLAPRTYSFQKEIPSTCDSWHYPFGTELVSSFGRTELLPTEVAGEDRRKAAQQQTVER